MFFEKGHLYHICNQGNNRQKVFFSRDNYLFFLKKVGTYISPYADILAWCIMPNHFHLMVYVKEIVIADATHGVTASHPVSDRSTTLNNSIAIMLRSYTRAINKEQNRSGALFREATKAECITKPEGIVPSFFNTNNGSLINVPMPEKEYPQICFNYIHLNPVKACLVDKPEDWEFSSYRDYIGERNGKLINRERTKEFELSTVVVPSDLYSDVGMEYKDMLSEIR
jgi:putative transposase